MEGGNRVFQENNVNPDQAQNHEVFEDEQWEYAGSAQMEQHSDQEFSESDSEDSSSGSEGDTNDQPRQPIQLETVSSSNPDVPGSIWLPAASRYDAQSHYVEGGDGQASIVRYQLELRRASGAMNMATERMAVMQRVIEIQRLQLQRLQIYLLQLHRSEGRDTTPDNDPGVRKRRISSDE